MSNQAANATESAKQTASQYASQAQNTASNVASQAQQSANNAASQAQSSTYSSNVPGGSRTVGDQFGTVGVAPSGNQAVHGVATIGVTQPVDPSIGNMHIRSGNNVADNFGTATITTTGTKAPYEKTEDELTGARTAL